MSCSDHEDHEYHVVTMRFSRWDKEISSWWMPNLTCSPPQEVPRGLTVTFLLPWGISRSHHEILLVTTRNLLVNQNFYLPPHQKLPRGLAVRFSLSQQGISQSHREILLVTTRNLLVNENFLPTPLPKASSWSRREILFVTTRNLMVSPWNSFGHHEESFGEWKFLPTPPPKASSWSRREILLVTTSNLQVNKNFYLEIRHG